MDVDNNFAVPTNVLQAPVSSYLVLNKRQKISVKTRIKQRIQCKASYFKYVQVRYKPHANATIFITHNTHDIDYTLTTFNDLYI